MNLEEYNRAVDVHADSLYRFVLKNLKDEAVSADLVQDVFEKLWTRLDSVDFLKVKSYLFTSAYHTLIDHIRRQKRFVSMEEGFPEPPASEREYSDLSEILSRAIALLPDDQRAVLMLRDYEGYSYKEIAKITELNESQVKVYIYRARVFLKNYIGSLEKVL